VAAQVRENVEGEETAKEAVALLSNRVWGDPEKGGASIGSHGTAAPEL